MLSLYLVSFMYFTQGPLHRLISYSKQGLDLLLKVTSEQLLNKKVGLNREAIDQIMQTLLKIR